MRVLAIAGFFFAAWCSALRLDHRRSLIPAFARNCGLLLLAAAASTSAAKAAQDAKLPLKPEREIQFTTERATWLSLDVSPTGAELVLEILGDLYLLPMQGGSARPITKGMAYDSQPKFSPDGERIAFISDRDGEMGVWTVDSEGGDPQKIASAGARTEFASPSWSPDGEHLVVSKTSWGLRTYEIWAYHQDGGQGVQITQAAPDGVETPTDQRHNALGAVYSPDGRYLYYAVKSGGFEYNQRFPQWQIVRRDLKENIEDVIVEAQGSAMRPLLSPDGGKLVYGTRFEQNTGLRLRHLQTGEDRWLAYPVQRDDQESRYTRDLLPGYGFTPDGGSVIFTHDGGIRRVALDSGQIEEIPFSADVALGLGPRLHFPWRLGLGPVKARLVEAPALSPNGAKVAFSAFAQVHVHDLESGATAAVSPVGMTASQPTWSPNGNHLAFVSWGPQGGHIWRMRARGGSPQRVSEQAGFYSDPVFSPDGERIVALRASRHDRLHREYDFGSPSGADVVWLPTRGGAARVIIPSRGHGAPHFGPDSDRLYLYVSSPSFAANAGGGLMSLRYDGTDRRMLLKATGAGIYFAEEEVDVDDIRLSPDGRHALIHHAQQLYVVRLLSPHLGDLTLSLTNPSLPLARLTDVGADFFGWNADGDELFWSAGHQFHQRALDAVEFKQDEKEKDESADDGADGGEDEYADENGQETNKLGQGGNGREVGAGGDGGEAQAVGEKGDAGEAAGGGDAHAGESGDGGRAKEEGELVGADEAGAVAADGEDGDLRNAATDDGGDGQADEPPVLEEHASVRSVAIEIYRPRYRPEGLLALTGARIRTLVQGEPALDDGVVLIEGDRILAVGPQTEVDIPPTAQRIDIAGKVLLPGYVDTHAHYRVLRRVHGGGNASFLANLAYGVTTGLDVQPSTTDILAYEDWIDAGLMLGPRALSTGPGIFNHNEFRSARHAEAVLTRYRDHYQVHNLKAYISGSRKQRQWLVQAAKKLKLMPTTEGALDMRLDMTHAIDGFSGNEHNFPVVDLHEDTVQLVARSGMAYTPTLLVTYGGPWAENYFYAKESPHDDLKLRRFTPLPFLAARTLRRFWFHDREYSFPRVAAGAAKIIRAGGRVGVGAHGQLQGLGYHWELWALVSGGLTPAEALTAATRHGAEIIGVAQDIGTIEAGKLADLVVLNSDPFDDIRNTADLALVVKGGELFEADTMNKLWPETKPLPAQWWHQLEP